MSFAQQTKQTTTTATTYAAPVERTSFAEAYRPSYSNEVSNITYSAEQRRQEYERSQKIKNSFSQLADNSKLFAAPKTDIKQLEVNKSEQINKTFAKLAENKSLFAVPVSKPTVEQAVQKKTFFGNASGSELAALFTQKKTRVSFKIPEKTETIRKEKKAEPATARVEERNSKISTVDAVSTKNYLNAWLAQNTAPTTSKSVKHYRDLNANIARKVLENVDSWATLSSSEFETRYHRLVAEEKASQLQLLNEKIKSTTDRSESIALRINVSLLKNLDSYLFKTEAEILKLHQAFDQLLAEDQEFLLKNKEVLVEVNTTTVQREKELQAEIQRQKESLATLIDQRDQAVRTMTELSRVNLESFNKNKQLETELTEITRKNGQLEKEYSEAKDTITQLRQQIANGSVSSDVLNLAITQISSLETKLGLKGQEGKTQLERLAALNVAFDEAQKLTETQTKTNQTIQKLAQALSSFSPSNEAEVETYLEELEKDEQESVKRLAQEFRNHVNDYKRVIEKSKKQVEELTSLSTDSGASLARIAQLEEENENLKRKNRTNKTNADTSAAQVISLTKDLAKVNTELDVYRNSNNITHLVELVTKGMNGGSDEAVFSEAVREVLQESLRAGKLDELLEASAKNPKVKGVIQQFIKDVVATAKSDLEEQLADRESDIKSLQDDINSLTESLRLEKEKSENLATLLAVAGSGNNVLQEKIETLEKELANKQEDFEKKLVEMEKKTKELAVDDVKVQELTKKLQLSEDKVKELEKEIRDTKTAHTNTIELLNTEIEEHKRVLATGKGKVALKNNFGIELDLETNSVIKKSEIITQGRDNQIKSIISQLELRGDKVLDEDDRMMFVIGLLQAFALEDQLLAYDVGREFGKYAPLTAKQREALTLDRYNLIMKEAKSVPNRTGNDMARLLQTKNFWTIYDENKKAIYENKFKHSKSDKKAYESLQSKLSTKAGKRSFADINGTALLTMLFSDEEIWTDY
jgi:hypothetical protein